MALSDLDRKIVLMLFKVNFESEFKLSSDLNMSPGFIEYHLEFLLKMGLIDKVSNPSLTSAGRAYVVEKGLAAN